MKFLCEFFYKWLYVIKNCECIEICGKESKCNFLKNWCVFLNVCYWDFIGFFICC